MRPNAIRGWMIAALAVAGVLSVVGKKEDSPFVQWLSFAFFLVAVYCYFQWRRALHNVREADEARARTDQ
jgi:cytochrome oxidase assembly protein ShyY1